MIGPYADIKADSISPDGVRLTTFEIRTWRYVLSEFNTHRMFSRNSASSRAIPLRKQIERILNSLAMPVVFPLEKKGMQGGDALEGQELAQAQSNWDKASKMAVEAAEALGGNGVHKSVANRLLEPFMWHTIIVTSTGWENFFHQRCSPLAQPEIRVTAELMREAYEQSEPREIGKRNWHLPYVWDDDEAIKAVTAASTAAYPDVGHNFPLANEWSLYHYELLCKISAARCARVSYLTQDGVRDIDKDLELYERLTTADPPHWSPLEHVATPWPWNRQEGCIHFGVAEGEDLGEDDHRCIPLDHLPRIGNLLGWRSLRTTVEAERGAVTYR